MPIIQTGVFALYERFPDKRDAIRALFEESETFKTLCEDHQKCREAIRYWNRDERVEAPLRRQEYEALIRELEGEILDVLKHCE